MKMIIKSSQEILGIPSQNREAWQHLVYLYATLFFPSLSSSIAFLQGLEGKMKEKPSIGHLLFSTTKDLHFIKSCFIFI